MGHISLYFLALSITLTIEGPIVFLGYRKSGRMGILVFLAANLFTHGTLWSIWPMVVGGSYWIKILVAESLVWLAEAGIFRLFLGRSLHVSLVVSGIANAASTTVGLLVWWLIGYR